MDTLKISGAVLISIIIQTAVAFADNINSPFSNPERTALVIIDMQERFVTRGGAQDDGDNPKKVENMVWRQGLLINIAKEHHLPILIAEYKNYGPTNSALMDALKGYDKVAVIQKTTDGLFDDENISRLQAQDQLTAWGVSDLVVSGANGGACVRETIRSALYQSDDPDDVNPVLGAVDRRMHR